MARSYNKSIKPTSVPGQRQTQIFGINDSGQVVGRYQDINGWHGFVGTPVPAPATFWLFGAGAAAWRMPKRRKVAA